MYLGHDSGRKVVPDCRRLGRDRRLQIVGCKKDIPCVLASTLISIQLQLQVHPVFFISNLFINISNKASKTSKLSNLKASKCEIKQQNT